MRDGFSVLAAVVDVPMRKQSTPWDRSPQIEAALVRNDHATE